ncbi:RNA-binding protein 5-like [Diabrotica undecimpunctata]|uniref:RNA-binding protein 5-like n=1 Tax=Diabrotica undecimpunctata TaxID=50387 RepID=UPI003B640692
MSSSPELFNRGSPNYRHKSESGSKSPVSNRRQNGYPKKSQYDSDSVDSDYAQDHVRENIRKARSRSPDQQDRDRDRRERHRTRDRDHRRQRSRSNSSRWEKKQKRDRDRDRCRDDDRDSTSERSYGCTPIGASGSEIIGFKSQPPNNTIMIRGLAQHISEFDIRQDIIACDLMPKDIRLIRKKDTGASRGFAFVEFSTLVEAVRWMEKKQGVLMLQDQYRAIMQYSIPKDSNSAEKTPSYKASADWFCIKCGAQNFKRRDNCFKCHASKTESEEGGSGSDEVCMYATKTIMLRNLDALTTEESVMAELKQIIPELVETISVVCIGRDPLTSTSRGLCYLETRSTVDSLAIFAGLSNHKTPLTIDGKSVIVSYCKYVKGDSKRPYSQADQDVFPNAAVPSTYSMDDVDSLAEYAARRYAKSPQEYMHYIEYYRVYFAKQITDGNSITLQENQMDAVNAAAAVAQSAIQQLNATKTGTSNYFDSEQCPTGVDGKKYPVPDTARYIYDKNTGYQYCQTTGLYYDPSSKYYWNANIQKWLYWDHDKQTYSLAQSDDGSNKQSIIENATQEPETKKQKVEKQDKVKVAKKIAKDMERWAKTLNQKKESCSVKTTTEFIGYANNASADIGFSVLEKKALAGPTTSAAASSTPLAPYIKEVDDRSPTLPGPLVAAYGGESDSSGEEDDDFLDYTNLICNLCKRRLNSAEALTKHSKMSSLHLQNLELRNKKSTKFGETVADKAAYRDRAKERRMKFGDPDAPKPSKLKEKYLKAREAEISMPSSSVLEPIGAENVGNRLLQKMGWTEGQGLGKQNQGRTSIIQAEQHSSTAGLGNKLAGYTAVAGESYKDCVKKMMYARYQELTEKELNN